MANVCELLLEVLANAGVKHIFSIPGGAINTLFEAIRKQDKIKLIHVRHEEAGAFAASAIGKLTGNIAVCLGTAGPGSIHLLNGLYDAKLDRSPVIAISGQVETEMKGIEYHQDVNLQQLFANLTVYNQPIINENQLPRVIEQTIKSSLYDKGVSHLILHGDIAGKEVKHAGKFSSFINDDTVLIPSENNINKAVELLDKAKKIVVLAGSGARKASEELLNLAHNLNAPIIKALGGKDIIPDEHPLCLGGLGLLGTKPAYNAMKSCDCLLMVGTDFPYEDFLPEKATIIQIDIEPKNIGKRVPVDVGLNGNSRETLMALSQKIPAKEKSDFLADLQKEMQDWWEELSAKENDESEPLHPQAVAGAISKLASDDAIFCGDTGNVTVWSARNIRIRNGQRFTLSGGLASMGYGLPAAIGAQLTFPGRQVWALCGDGGFAMMMGDFLTAVQYKLPIVVVIFDNHKLGMIQMEQEAMGYPEFETDLHNPDFAAFATVCGGAGIKVKTFSQLYESIEIAMKSELPFILDCEVNPEEITWPPHINFGQAAGFAKAKVKEILNIGKAFF